MAAMRWPPTDRQCLEWVERFHIDGLRVDAVASMLYRDYSRAEGSGYPTSRAGANLQAVAFPRRMNQTPRERFRTCW